MKLMPYEPVMGRFITQLRKTTENTPRVKYCNLRIEVPDENVSVCEKKSP